MGNTAKLGDPGVVDYSLTCPECGAPLRLKDSRHGLFYGCTRFPQCKASHGAHADGTPLGIPADEATKRARIVAHAAFDAFWQGRGWSRSRGYCWLQEQLHLTSAECHLARFDQAQCKRVLDVVAGEIFPVKALRAQKRRAP
jgi:ssDNA-binding Zn-finger/Zn-ribbon topoisomerase 1